MKPLGRRSFIKRLGLLAGMFVLPVKAITKAQFTPWVKGWTPSVYVDADTPEGRLYFLGRESLWEVSSNKPLRRLSSPVTHPPPDTQ